MRKISLIWCLFFLILLSAAYQKDICHEEDISTKLPNSNKVGVQNINSKSPYSIKKREYHGVVDYQREITSKYIDEVLNNPVNCDLLVDNEQALKELIALLEKENCNDVYNEYGVDVDHPYKIFDNFTIEKEKRLQEATKGRICFAFPNSTALEELVNIWRKYPCSEAAISALGQINDTIQVSHINYINQGAYEKEMLSIYKYIIENYPESWQVEASNVGYAIYRYGYISEESLQAHEQWLEYMEKNEIYKNEKYYTTFLETNEEYFPLFSEYNNLASLYNMRFKKLAKHDIEEKGKVPSAAIKLYQKQCDLMIRLQTNYPNHYRPKEYAKTHENDYCQKQVKKHAPDHYRGSIVIKKDNKKKDK